MLPLRPAVAVLLAAFMLAGTGCGDDGKDPSAARGATSTTVAPETTTTSTAPPPPSSTTTVTVPATTTTATTTTATTTTATTAPAETTLSPGHYGSLTLGMALAKAKRDGLVTNIRAGCEASGGGEIAADVPGKPGAYVTFNNGKLTGIILRKGKTAEGLGIGATIDQARKIYTGNGYTFTVTDSTVEVFDILTVTVERNGTAAYGFAADPNTKIINAMAIPDLAYCD